ncbi:TatD DNase family protein [Thermodesulfovibrio aggregans]|uniref:TatD DNase family protein n=1 Tax=Thermodesulfovibrio aggregans TaxID=86166 RepID=A0A0U9HPI1_9BACT|nr:TatD family hydrolase [Thermodesulfovibrio aggregans]GAQ94940.1 TatD DNase family protein [Thermodesulfovibrio aggregans]
MIDSHCHLEMFKEELSDVVRRAYDSGVSTIVTVASDVESLDEVVKIAEQYPMVYATVGIHPHDAKDFNDKVLKKIFELSRHPKVIAIGEIGLDYHYDNSPREAQKSAFVRQLELARDLGLPVVVHSREAFDDTIKILKESGVSRGVLHCFSGNLSQAKKAIELGFLISISGVVTFKNAKKIKEVAQFVPDDYLLIETDAPYLAPEPMRGKGNEPAFLIYTARELAELRGVTVEDIDRITTVNTYKLFQIGNLPKGEIAYKIRDTLYLNVTNRCTNVCRFCVRFHTDYVKGHNLRLEREPSSAELIEAIGDPKNYKEIVFCGYGEPFLRLDLIKEVAKWIKEHGGRVRINTNGQGNLIHDRKILPELAGLIDSISISLNAQDKETYNRICNPANPDAYEAVIEFIKDAKEFVPKVQVTVVDVREVDLKKCEELANSLGVSFKIRHLDQVG